LPSAGNPGSHRSSASFLASFSIALISHAPGGLGVLEFAFVKAMRTRPPLNCSRRYCVPVAYLIIPLIFALVVVVAFERHKIAELLRRQRLRAPIL